MVPGLLRGPNVCFPSNGRIPEGGGAIANISLSRHHRARDVTAVTNHVYETSVRYKFPNVINICRISRLLIKDMCCLRLSRKDSFVNTTEKLSKKPVKLVLGPKKRQTLVPPLLRDIGCFHFPRLDPRCGISAE